MRFYPESHLVYLPQQIQIGLPNMNPMNDLPPPFDAVWFRLIIGAVFGAIVGSFMTMLVYRLPRGKSIVLPRSACPRCGHVLGLRDLVPLLSWITSGGKCRHCGAAIGWRYLLIEIGFAVVGGLLFNYFLPRLSFLV